jgi:tRNA(Ile)-lysidine synthase
MAGSQPPRAAVRAAVRACLADLEPGERVIVALSGGADSLALTAAAVVVGDELGLLCEAVVIDHQLQAGSAEVATRAADQARILGCVSARVIAVDVPRGAGSGGVEAAARAARYAALDAAALGVGYPVPPAATVLLGHTREDQAETVLLGLARGSGTRSLAGMAQSSGVHRRPLLDLPRDVVVAAALETASADPRLEPWSDPHNDDPGFARVRVRHDVLPMLEGALGPGIVEALARTATLAREDADALDSWADQVWAQVVDVVAPPGPPALPVAALTSAGEPLPPAIVHRVVRRLLVEAGCPTGVLTSGHIRAVAALLEPGASARAEVALPGGLRARREAGALVVRV